MEMLGYTLFWKKSYSRVLLSKFDEINTNNYRIYTYRRYLDPHDIWIPGSKYRYDIWIPLTIFGSPLIILYLYKQLSALLYLLLHDNVLRYKLYYFGHF